MEESVKTMKLNNRMYYVLAEMVHKNTKYYYLVNNKKRRFLCLI